MINSFMMPQSRFDIFMHENFYWISLADVSRQKTNNNKLQIDLNSYVYKFLPKSFI